MHSKIGLATILGMALGVSAGAPAADPFDRLTGDLGRVRTVRHEPGRPKPNRPGKNKRKMIKASKRKNRG